MDFLKTNLLNESDIKDLMRGFDKALKVRLSKEGFLESRFQPKIYLGESQELLEQNIQREYERPFITFNLVRRGPASLSDTNFFTGQLHYGVQFKRTIDEEKGISRGLIQRDNEIALKIRAKTKTEIYFLLQILERTIIFESKYITNVDIIRFKESNDNLKIISGLYHADFVFRARTKIEVEIRDNTKLLNIDFVYKNRICKYFDVSEHVCRYYEMFGSLDTCEDYNEEVQPPTCRPVGSAENAQRESEATDLNCYRGCEWCSQHKDVSTVIYKD